MQPLLQQAQDAWLQVESQLGPRGSAALSKTIKITGRRNEYERRGHTNTRIYRRAQCSL